MVKREFENTEPIVDGLVVLDLLYTDRWEYKTDRRLLLPHPNYAPHRQAYVRVDPPEMSCRDFLVAEHLGELLLSRMLVQGKAHWGHTDYRDLSISDYGRALVREVYERCGVPYDFSFGRRLRSDRWIMAHRACTFA